MSQLVPLEVKEQIRDATDIVDLIGATIALRREGRNYAGRCPWHDDSKPSLKVNPQRQTFKCWVCDIGGDCFDFVQRVDGVSFPEALQGLAERAGIALEQRRQAPIAPGGTNDKSALLKVTEWAEQRFHQFLLTASDASSARQYLLDRGITGESVQQFRIGYAPNSFDWLRQQAPQAGFSVELLEAAGLLKRNEQRQSFYDAYRGRVIFPIHDTYNRPIAFGGRILPEFADDKAAKYINSPETRLFSKSKELYGLNLARKATGQEKVLTVVEGYTDVIMAHQFGVSNVVACLGTAINEQHIRVLGRHADRVNLILDGDAAGQRRTNEILELFVAADMDLRIQTLPEGLDPCDFLQQFGAEKFQELASQAIDAIEHRILVETQGVNLVQDTHRANKALENILAILAVAPTSKQGVDLRRKQVVTRLARKFGVTPQDLNSRLRELSSRKRRTTATATDTRELEVTPRQDSQRLSDSERELFEVLCLEPRLVPQALAALTGEICTTSIGKRLFELFVAANQADEVLEFKRLLTLSEDSQIKNQLITLAEAAEQKSSQATMSSEERLQSVIASEDEQRLKQQNREKRSLLDQAHIDEEEKISALLHIVEHHRKRQGI